MKKHSIRLNLSETISFKQIKTNAAPYLLAICRRVLPDGYTASNEYVARNPLRSDKNYGSFKINLVSGRWSDFASGEAGNDIISLIAYLYEMSQAEAACVVARMVGEKI